MIGDPDLSVGSPADRAHEMELRLVEFLRISDEPLPNLAADRIEKLEREVERLQDKLHCMCGSPIDHSAWEGHSPVSMYDYALDRERERVATLERVRAAAQALANHCKRGVNVGPVSLAPATEAALWINLRSALERAGEP